MLLHVVLLGIPLSFSKAAWRGPCLLVFCTSARLLSRKRKQRPLCLFIHRAQAAELCYPARSLPQHSEATRVRLEISNHHTAELHALRNQAIASREGWAVSSAGRINLAATKGLFTWVQTTAVTKSLQDKSCKGKNCVRPRAHRIQPFSITLTPWGYATYHHQNLFSLQAFDVTLSACQMFPAA